MYHASFSWKNPQQPVRTQKRGWPQIEDTRQSSARRRMSLEMRWALWPTSLMPLPCLSCAYSPSPPRLRPTASSSPPPHSTQGRGGDLHWFGRSAMLLFSTFSRSDPWQVDQLRHGSVSTHACRISQGVRGFSAAVLSSDMHYTHTHVNDNSFWYQSKQK